MKQKLANKMKQKWMDFMSFLSNNKLKEKNRTHKTFVRRRLAGIWTVPIWVTTSNFSFGSLTLVDILAVIEVKREMEQIIWSVATVSIIHLEWLLETGGTK
jgi:predicted Zn-dependent protease